MARGKRFTHREFVYTGNHPNGTNTIYENGQQALMQHIGLSADDAYEVFGKLSEARHFDGKSATIEENGYQIGVIQAVIEEENGFGYTFRNVYRVEQVQ